MKIDTLDFISAYFFMKDEEVKSELPILNPVQVHGRDVFVLDDGYSFSEQRPKADGILLKTHNYAASLKFADCAPVLLYPGNKQDWVMILHSGFKGTVLNIAGEGVKLVSNPQSVHEMKGTACRAWIGPCIGFENYMRDINDEWTQKGLEVFHPDNYRISGNKVYFNLAGEIHSQLIKVGLAKANITCANIDTFTNPDCYSYRRGDITQRMTLLVSLHSHV